MCVARRMLVQINREGVVCVRRHDRVPTHVYLCDLFAGGVCFLNVWWQITEPFVGDLLHILDQLSNLEHHLCSEISQWVEQV